VTGAGPLLASANSPAHVAGIRSRQAAVAHDQEAWLAVFADDAVVEDPIGPSHFDPEGKGHRGKEAIAKFYDMAIAATELTLNFERTYQCGNVEANVANNVIRSAGYEIAVAGVFTYRVNDEGKIFMPMINNVVALGKTRADLESEISKRLKTYIKNPVVTVEITNPQNTSIWVTGEVASPGEIKVKPDARLLDVPLDGERMLAYAVDLGLEVKVVKPEAVAAFVKETPGALADVMAEGSVVARWPTAAARPRSQSTTLSKRSWSSRTGP